MNTSGKPPVLMPGEWLGMLGGGQLGRMFCHAAQSLGYKVAVLDPDPLSPAGAVAEMHIQAAYDDANALEQLASRCRAVTTEFENVPASSLEKLAAVTLVRPGAKAVAIVQDRITEKAFLDSSGVPVAPYRPIESADDLAKVPGELFPGILKSARLGYDGKGQSRVRNREEALQAFQDMGGKPCVLEAMLPLAREISVVLARGADGKTVVYPSAVNEHRDGILAVSTVDAAQVSGALSRRASEAALRIAQALEYIGVLCVEFFVLEDGSLVANEIAPRPHNSGHYTMNASVASQFEQQARATAGLPLADTSCLCSAVMLNLLGDLWFDSVDGTEREPDWASVLSVPGAQLHLYGKAQARRGRKMGHINVLGATVAQANERAARVADALSLPFGA